jgi:hypothetical protein
MPIPAAAPELIPLFGGAGTILDVVGGDVLVLEAVGGLVEVDKVLPTVDVEDVGEVDKGPEVTDA